MPGEVTYWMSQLQAGYSFEQIIVNVTADVGYYLQTRAGHNINGNDINFVTQIYQDLFHRGPSPFERDQLFVPQLATAELAARTQDARTLLGGQEYQTQVIKNAYLKLLGRAAGGSEVPNWLGLL